VRYALLAALCWIRQAELVDGLVELLIGLIKRINARAERRVEKELIGELAHVPGKRGILGRMVNAALERPEGTVRQVVFPAVPGGEKTLRTLAKELMATERVIAERVRYQLRGLLLPPLPADAGAVAGRTGVQVQQHRLPARHGRDRPVGPLRRRRFGSEVLRRRGDGAAHPQRSGQTPGGGQRGRAWGDVQVRSQREG
jgi:hypothetical protein